jgi:hypothetical protein
MAGRVLSLLGGGEQGKLRPMLYLYCSGQPAPFGGASDQVNL